MRQYQEQAIVSASPELLVAKLYDIAVSACHRGDRSKVRAVIVELIAGLNFEAGGDIAANLYSLYEFCLTQAIDGDLDIVCELLTGLRDAWRESLLPRQAA
jgi:flagellar secretion chaperone FliS